VEYEDINSGQGTLNKDLSKKVSIKAGIQFQPGDVLYGKLRPYLRNWLYADFSGIAVGDFWVLRGIDVDGLFLYSLIQSDAFDEVANQSTGTKMPRSDWPLVSNTVFSLPVKVAEQRKIGEFLLHIDHLITLHQREQLTIYSGGNIC
jgi:type I restriction enzyme S subunit